MTIARALLVALALAGASALPVTAAAQGDNPPHGQPGHVHGDGAAPAAAPAGVNPPHGQPGHVHGDGAAPAARPANPPHGQPGHVHGDEAPAGRPANPPHGQPGHVHGDEAPGGEAARARAGEPGDAAVAQAGEPGTGFGNGRGAALFFWVMAGATVAGSLFVITRRNLITAVMGMVGTFFAIAALYAMLYAHFLAVIQVLVYAGAIMVLFVFVVMILNRPEDEPWALQGLVGKALASLAILYLVFRLSGVLWDVKDTPHAVVAGPRPLAVDTTQSGTLPDPVTAAARQDDWGSTRAVGKVLFREYLFPFEAVSLVLLVAVVGGIALARPREESDDEHADAPTAPNDPHRPVRTS